MLRFCLLFLLFAALPFTTVSAQDSPQATVTVSRLNVRAEPNTSAAILTQIRFNQTFDVIARNESGTWWQIVVNGNGGWVFGRYIRLRGDTSLAYIIHESGTRPTPLIYPTVQPSTCTNVTLLVPLTDPNLCPINVINMTPAAFQRFEGGFMIWLSSTDDIVALTSVNALFISLPNYADLPDVTDGVPAGLVSPINGFGRVWWNNLYGARDLLGYAQQAESGYSASYQWIYNRLTDRNLLYVTTPDGGVIGIDPNGLWFAVHS